MKDIIIGNNTLRNVPSIRVRKLGGGYVDFLAHDSIYSDAPSVSINLQPIAPTFVNISASPLNFTVYTNMNVEV